MDDRPANPSSHAADAAGGSVRDLVRLARPEHWIKNGIVVLPVVFAKRIADPTAWLQACIAAVAFCIASSAIYALNDLLDRQRDRVHPAKRTRPVAAGRVTVRAAGIESAILAIAAVALALAVNWFVVVGILAFFLLQLAYSLGLKQRMLVDVICIALGFVLRAAVGALAIRVAVSPWLVICTFTLCLFMGFSKRRNEIASMPNMAAAARHRPTLIGYTPELLTHLITLSGGLAIVSYLLYASSPRTIAAFGTPYLIYTLPLVVYGVCRFAMLAMQGSYSDPTNLILRDRPFQINLALWFVLVVGIIFWGNAITARLLIAYD